MKLKNFILGAIAASTLSMMACNDNEGGEVYEYDYYPIVLNVYVTDSSETHNFFAENINDYASKTILNYRDKNFVLNGLSKTYMPHFRGLFVDTTDKVPHLVFGELDGAREYDDNFVLSFPDGTSDTIHLKRVHNGGMNVVDQWTLNGKEFDGSCDCEIKLKKAIKK